MPTVCMHLNDLNIVGILLLHRESVYTQIFLFYDRLQRRRARQYGFTLGKCQKRCFLANRIYVWTLSCDI